MSKDTLKNRFSILSKSLLITSLTFSTLSYAKTEVNRLPIIQNEIDYKQLLSRRQMVDILLQEALTALKSPARVSNAGLTAKAASNIEIVIDRLLKAYQIEPQRIDLLISAANAYIENKQVDKALELFNKISMMAPDNLDTHSYLALWNHFKKDENSYQKEISILNKLNKNRADDIQRIIATINGVTEIPLKETRNQPLPQNSAIVTLGYALNPDGSMDDVLIKRLDKTLELAQQNRSTYIIVTGGVPKNHKTEAALMSQWLQQKGIEKSRIIEDNYATNTITNALYSTDILAQLKVSHAVIISSASHVRRGQSLFTIASWQNGPHEITYETISYPDRPLSELEIPSNSELLSIYRDAIRTYGLWNYRSAPLELR